MKAHKILRQAKQLSGKTYDEIGPHSRDLGRDGGRVNLKRADWFLKGCGLRLSGLVAYDHAGRRIYLAGNGEVFEIESLKPMEVEKPLIRKRKPVVKMDLEGNEIERFESLSDAGKSRTNITRAITTGGTAYGFRWKWG